MKLLFFVLLLSSCNLADKLKEKVPELPKLPLPSKTCVADGKTYQLKTLTYPNGGYAFRPNSDCKAPIIVGNNGTGAQPIYYRREAQKLAEAGFLVVWPKNTNTGNGRTCLEGFEWARSQPNVYLEKYGILGHSQGGSATMTCGYQMEQRFPYSVGSFLPVQPAFGMGNASITSQMKSMKGNMLIFGGTRDILVSDIWIQRGYSAYGAKKGWIQGVPATHFDQGKWIVHLAPLWFKYSMFDSKEGKEGIEYLAGRSDWNWKYPYPL